MFEDIKSRILSYGNKRNKLVSILGIRKTFNTKTSASDTFRADPLCDDIMAATSYLPDRCGVPFRIKCIFSGITHAPKCPVCGKDCAPIDSNLSAKYACFMKTCGGRSCKAKHAASFIEMTPEILRAHAEAQIKHKDRVRESYRRFASLYASGEFKRLPKANIVSFCENLILRRNRNGKIVRECDFVENVDMLCSIVLETVHMIPIVIDASHNRIDMSEFRFNERIYCIVNSIDTVPVCKYCGGEVRFNGMSNGYSASCPACGVDKCRECKGHMTKPQILACIDTTKYEIVNFPIKSGDYLVIKCKRCGYVSKWWTGNGFLQALMHKDLCKNCEVFDSEAEHEVAEFIRNECGYDVLRNDRSVISPQELDVFVPDRKVAIEFDGFYYHSDDRIGRGYHLFKTNRCNDIGVSLIHIFESEWISRRDSVKREISLALGHAIEHTRCDCKSRIAEIQKYEYDELACSASVGMFVTDDDCKYYGLFCENELVAGMIAFNRYRHEYDISGICVKIGWDIDETAGNMLRLFEGSFNMTRIRLFVDRRFPTHDFVKWLGYDFAYNTKTRGWWFSCKDHRHGFNMTYDDGTQEMSEKMKSNGYKRIFDCGNAVFTKSYVRQVNSDSSVLRRKDMFCIKSVNEASENDFAGKDTIIVVSAVTGKRVEKTSAQKARDARNPNAFGDDYVVRPMGAEIYYLVDSATADDLTSTDLFYSSVRPESDQLFFKIKKLSPVIVHTTGTRGGRSTNFGYRESNDFIDNCLTLKQVMEGAFGAKNVRVFNFKTSHNDRLRFCEYRDDGKAVEDWGMWYEATDLSKFESGAGKKLVRAVSKSWREVTPQLKHDPILRPASELDEFFANLKPMKLSLAEDEAALCKMKDDFVEEGFEQTEFDFSYNKKNDELEWKPVFDAIRAAEQGLRPTKFQFVNSQPSLISAPAGADVVAEYFHDGGLMIAARFRMSDPLDSEFYEEHHPLLGAIAGNMPKGFVAEFADADADGSSRRFIGTKEVLSKDVSRYSGPAGVETSDMYDVVETLVIRRAGDVTEDDNPDDAKTDGIFIKGDKYEAALKAGQQVVDDFIEVDFPAWALDYAVNAELGSVSRTEKFAVDKWFEMIDREGYDVNAISYGEDEYFSSEPEFGLPCDCVKAKLQKKVISEGARPDYFGDVHKNIDPVAKYLDMFV